MNALPQLRLRSEFSFRQAYGSVQQLAESCAALETPSAGLVDTAGTWGHVQWEKVATAAGVQPMFGCEFPLTVTERRKPRVWGLAEGTAGFYRFSSACPTTLDGLLDRDGTLLFSGGAAEDIQDPAAVDYVDINPRSRTQTLCALNAAQRLGKPLVITSDNDFPAEQHAERFAAWTGGEKITPQRVLTVQDLRQELGWIGADLFDSAVQNTHEVAERCAGLKLEEAPMIHFEGDLRAEVMAGKALRLAKQQIPNWTDEYEARLQRELQLIEEKQYESYFLVVAELVVWAKRNMLVGPARGSSAGSLVCYLLRITEVDPLVHGLIFERFIDVNRDDLPDIDIDFNDQKRELVFEHLRERYGADCVARIGSVNRLKPRSVIAHVGRKLGIPHGAAFNVTNVLIEYSSGDSRYGKGLEDTLTNTQPGRDFTEKYPESVLMGELENHASHTGQHAAGIIVSNRPVTEFCTVRDGIAHVDKYDAEALNLLKIDALGLRTLGVIEDAGCVTAEELYSMTYDAPEVFEVFNDNKYSGVFQFEGAAQRRVARQVPVERFQHIDHVTALARPGPLGGGAANTYINRNAGRESVSYLHPSMEEYLGETQGVVLYQEQVMRVVRELGAFSWEDTSVIRKAMSGRKGKEFFDRHGDRFVEGAADKGLSADEARAIWEEICSFGAWGMNKSHTVSYGMISYWCAHMKAHHPTEYAAACLRSAKDDEQAIEILREMSAEGVEYSAFNAQLSGLNWQAVNGRLLGGYVNLHGIGAVKARKLIDKRDTIGLSEKELQDLSERELKFQDLTPAHTRWGKYYADPSLLNVHGRIKQISQLQDRENAVLIVQLIRQERRDQNETVRLNKRGYAMKGQTLFLDAFVADDSVSKPVVARINQRLWNKWGEKMADRAVPGEDWFLVRGDWLEQFSMLSVRKIMCLTNGEMFN